MLTVTTNATAVIERLTSHPELPEGAGLRISSQSEGFGLSVTPEPEQGDQVMQEAGARLFLEPDAAEALADKTLDAQVDSGGSVQFFLAE